MFEREIIGDPTMFSDDQWRSLADLVEEHRHITINFVVDLPPIGVGDYDARILAITRILRQRLNAFFKAFVIVSQATRTGGAMARVGYEFSISRENKRVR